MGRLYQRTVSGNKTLAYFESDRVRGDNDTAKWLARYNNMGQIFITELFGENTIIANCDINGNIRKGSDIYGWVLAKCQDGIIFEGSNTGGRILAHFDGDMFGAAAAVAVILLTLQFNT